MSLMSNKSKSRYILWSIVLIILSVSYVRSGLEVLKSKDRLDEIKSEVAHLEEEKNELKKEIDYKKTPEYIEEKARNELNLIRPGEKLYVVVGENIDVENKEEVLSETDLRSEDEKKEKNWYSWYRLFFNN